MNLQIRKYDLQAALTCAALKDTREYLNGVYLEFVPNGEGGMLTFVGTNGHLLFAGTAPAVFNDGEQTAPFWMIIPRNTVKTACRGKYALVSLVSLPDGRYSLGDFVFAPIDARFPDFRRVFPEKTNGELAQFDPDLLAQGNDALRIYFQSPNAVYRLNHNGNGTAVICGNSRDACVAIMPIREQGSEYAGVDIPAFPPQLRVAA